MIISEVRPAHMILRFRGEGVSELLVRGEVPILFDGQILGKGMRRSTFQWKKGLFSEKGGGNSVNGGFGKDFYRKGNSVKRSGPFTEPPESEKWKVALLIPFLNISSEVRGGEVPILFDGHGDFSENAKRSNTLPDTRNPQTIACSRPLLPWGPKQVHLQFINWKL